MIKLKEKFEAAPNCDAAGKWACWLLSAIQTNGFEGFVGFVTNNNS